MTDGAVDRPQNLAKLIPDQAVASGCRLSQLAPMSVARARRFSPMAPDALFELSHDAGAHCARSDFTLRNAGADSATEVALHQRARREVQCVEFAAAGKTDGKVGVILGLSAPTIRFHRRRAGRSQGENGRLRRVRRAVALGLAQAN